MIDNNNEELKNFFASKWITNVFAFSNRYCDVFITDKPKKDILEMGVIKALGEEQITMPSVWSSKKWQKKNFWKFIKVQPWIIKFDDFFTEDFLKDLDSDWKTWFSCWVDIETGEKVIEYFKDYTNIHIAGAQGSGKSVLLFALFYQLYQKKHSEFIIFDKGDLQFMNVLPKVVAGANVLNDCTENLFQLYNYLFLQGRKRKSLFAKAGVNNLYEYMEKYYDPNDNTVTEPLNHIFVIMDEFNTWRSNVDEDLGSWSFDTKMGRIINVLRFAGVSLIPATQTLYASDIGVLSRGGMKAVYSWNVTKADAVDNQDILNNLKKYLTKTFLFYWIQTNKFYKSPFVVEGKEFLDIVNKIPLDENYSNLKTDTLSRLVNKYIIDEKDSSKIMNNYVDNFRFFWLTTNQVKELEEDFLFIPFAVLIYKIKDMFDKGVLNSSYDIRQPLKFKAEANEENIDNTIQGNLWILFSKEEKKFINEIEASLELAENDPEEFIVSFGEIIRISLIRRWIIGVDNEEDTKELSKKEKIKNTEFDSKDDLLSQVLNEDAEELDFDIDDDDNNNSSDTDDFDDDDDDNNNEEHEWMQDIAKLLRDS